MFTKKGEDTHRDGKGKEGGGSQDEITHNTTKKKKVRKKAVGRRRVTVGENSAGIALKTQSGNKALRLFELAGSAVQKKEPRHSRKKKRD